MLSNNIQVRQYEVKSSSRSLQKISKFKINNANDFLSKCICLPSSPQFNYWRNKIYLFKSYAIY